MAKSLTVFISSTLFGLFISIYLASFIATQTITFDIQDNYSVALQGDVLNDTKATTEGLYQDFQSSQSDQSSQLSLFKNAPSTIKKMTGLGFRQFGALFNVASDNFVPYWIIVILVALFVIYIVSMLVRLATGQTP